jgi:aspartokinase
VTHQIKNPRIRGLRVSNELAQVNVVAPLDHWNLESGIFHVLAEKKINMHMLSSTCLDGRTKTSFCVEERDTPKVKDLLKSELSFESQVTVFSGLGALSLFPHQSSLKILGLSLVALGKASIPIYGMTSSLSSLTFVIDYTLLNLAVGSLKTYLELPPEF